MKEVSIYTLLDRKYPAAEHVLMREVSDASGSGRSRSLDYMVVNLWNSRGLAITGIEVKSWRSDWLRELKNPGKQENHFKFCDYFYLLTTEEDIAKIAEIPETWGWLTIKGERIMIKKDAPKQNPMPVDRSFLCAMLRRAAAKDGWIHEDSIQNRLEEARQAHNQHIQRNLDNANKALTELREKVAVFEKASGVGIGDRWERNQDKIGEAVKFVMAGGPKKWEGELQELHDKARRIYSSVEKEIKAINSL